VLATLVFFWLVVMPHYNALLLHKYQCNIKNSLIDCRALGYLITQMIQPSFGRDFWEPQMNADKRRLLIWLMDHGQVLGSAILIRPRFSCVHELRHMSATLSGWGRLQLPLLL